MDKAQDKHIESRGKALLVNGAFWLSLLILLATVAGLSGWQTPLMLIVAAAGGLVIALLTGWRLHRQHASGQAANAALKDIQIRLGGIVESAMDAVIIVDERQRIVLFNAAAEQMFLCSREQALDSPLDWFIPDRYRKAHAHHVREFGNTGVTSRRMGAARIITGLRRNGEEFPIDASISHVQEHGARFFTVILRDVTERVATEAALRDSREELRAFATAAHSVREQEKSRIARELHDELGQALTALKMDVNWIQAQLPAEDSQVRQKLGKMQTLLDNTVAATRRISTEMRPLILDDLGVVAALEWLVENFSQRTGVPCQLTVGDPDAHWPDPLATAIFRIVQESLTNIARHAQASEASISLTQTATEVLIDIRDDGRGFSQDEASKPNSFGLLGLRERAYLLGGVTRIDSPAGRGTHIAVRLPLPSEGVNT
ncbi:PAS domain-containing sensor histidine kinase [Chitinimonas naiadis]